MQPKHIRQAIFLGAALTVLNTIVSVTADALAKDLIATYAAPQLMLLSGAITVLIGLIFAGAGRARLILHTGTPIRLAIRSLFGVISTVGFFYALRYLPFAEVFLFIGIMPIFGAGFSSLLLKEAISPRTWGALVFGFVGLLFLFPDGIAAISLGHWLGLMAAITGTISIVLSRSISRDHTHALAQVFYAQVACILVGLIFLPQVAQSMPWHHVAQVVAYTGFIILTRWLVVVILRMLPAYIMMQITNLQFVWMVFIGQLVFHEATGLNVWFGSALIIASGAYLLNYQKHPVIRSAKINSVEV